MKSYQLFCLLGIMCLFLMPNQTYAQVQLTSTANMFRCGDSIIRRQIGYFPPGGIGEGQEWDLRNMDYLDNIQVVRFTCDSDSVNLYGMEPLHLRKFKIRNDSLFTLGYETRLHSIEYEKPMILNTYPYSYGDSTLQNIHGIGTYCGKYAIESHGTMETEADATGKILFNDDDTLHHVLRIHRIYASGIHQYNPSDSLRDDSDAKQRIEEHYLWYAQGYRYPVYETITTSIYHNCDLVSCQQSAYCTLPSDQLHLNDSVNQDIRQLDSLNNVQASLPLPIRYHITTSSTHIDISYELLTDAMVHALLCDKMGVVYKRASASGLSEENGHLLISTNGLRCGTYVLYLNVNGVPRSEIVVIP